MSTKVSKRELFGKGAVSAGLGIGALALMARTRPASADTPFTSFPFAAAGAPTPRTMPARLAEIKNVKDFGAVGDGAADDTGAIQAAVNWTSGGNRGVIFFPPGTYRVTSPVTFNYNGGLSIVFRGVNGLSTIVGNFPDYLLKRDLGNGNPTSGGRVIENLNFMNGHAAGGCVRFSSTVGGAVRDCTFSGFRCLNLTDTDTNSVQSFTVDACQFSSGGISNAIGIIVGGNCTILDCDLTGFGTAAIRPYGVGVNIIGCRMEVNGVGIQLGLDEPGTNRSLSGFSIVGCTFESNGTAIDFAGGSGHGLIVGLIIHGFQGATIGGGNPQYGIRTRGDNCQFTTFSGIFVGGQMQQAAYSVTDTTNRNGLVFNSCHGSNASTLGGVVWQLPTRAHTATWVGCDVRPAFTFSGLPSQPLPGDQFFITDSNQSSLGGTVTGGGGSTRGFVVWNGSAWTLMSK